MASKQCQHSNRVRSVVELDFSRPDTPNDPVYSIAVSAGVCEECGHIELHVESHKLLCDWLRKR
jgi:hypothetical protein